MLGKGAAGGPGKSQRRWAAPREWARTPLNRHTPVVSSIPGSLTLVFKVTALDCMNVTAWDGSLESPVPSAGEKLSWTLASANSARAWILSKAQIKHAYCLQPCLHRWPTMQPPRLNWQWHRGNRITFLEDNEARTYGWEGCVTVKSTGRRLHGLGGIRCFLGCNLRQGASSQYS